MLKRMVEYLEMKWLMDGWKYVLALAVAVGVAYVVHPYVAIWLYEMGSSLYNVSWIFVLLAVIGAVTVLGIFGMIIQVTLTNFKTSFMRK